MNPPSEAPRDGAMILGHFGWPWLLPACWNEHDERWAVAVMQSQEISGKNDPWFETDNERSDSLIGWLPYPPPMIPI